MNIFKILANGDGSIKEPNISAFLGYLLNPYEDHGLGFEFLERFLDRFFVDEEEDFNVQGFDYEIVFEQAFRDEKKTKKEIVDIVILCFENNKGRYKELIAESMTKQTRELKYIFLLENKVTTHSIKDKQLEAQFKNTIKTLDIDESKVISLYVTPEDSKYDEVFEKFVENEHKAHYVWKSKNEDNQNDIYKILLNIIEDESKGKIEVMNNYTKHTLISFVKFIENNFKSQKEEEKVRKNDGKYTQEYIDLNNKSKIERKLNTLRSELIKRNPHLEETLSFADLSQPRFPFIALELNEIDIFIHAGAKSRDVIKFNYRSNSRHPDSFTKLEEIANKLNIEIKKRNYKKDAYAQTEKMKKLYVSIDDYDTIFKELEEIVNQI